MLIFPNIDPVALELGPLKVHWYGLMYVLGFAAAWWLGRRRAAAAGLSKEQVDDLIFYGALGVVLGGRLGSVFFYNFQLFVHDPLMIFRIWEGGMSFHGGLLGVLTAMWLYAHKLKRGLFEITDFVAPLVPLGLLAGRLGNFINGELWGRPSNLPWAMIFPHADRLPRHPSQLYEAALEGVVLFVLVWWFSRKPRPVMAVSAVFLAGYGSLRFLVEFAREPDANLGFVALNWMSMGQLLSLPMIVIGLGLLAWSYRRP